MQVGPAIESIPEIDTDILLRQYAARPISFLHEYLLEHGTSSTRAFISEHQAYQFISDLFGEWLARAENPSTSQAYNALVSISREIIGKSTLSDLADTLQAPLAILTSVDGNTENEVVAGLLIDLHLTSLATKVRAAGRAIRHSELLTVLSADSSTSTSVAQDRPSDYTEFLGELKEAGIIIPPASKAGKKAEATAFSEELANVAKPAKRRTIKIEAPVNEEPLKSAKPKPRPAPSKPSSVEAMLSPDAQAKIVTKIFRDDVEDYGRSMELINKAKDWKQASIYLDALFMRRKVDPYSKTAIRLTDAVYARFNSSK